MASHYHAQDDSSDEDELMDLDAFRRGGVSPARAVDTVGRAPASASKPSHPIQIDSDQDNSDESDTPASTTFQNPLERNAPFLSPAKPIPVTFRSIASQRKSPSVESELDMALLFTHGLAAESQEDDDQEVTDRRGLFVQLPQQVVDRGEYEDYTAGSDRVRRILRKSKDDKGNVGYKVLFDDFHIELIPFENLLDYDNGKEALQHFNNYRSSQEESYVDDSQLVQGLTARDRAPGRRGRSLSSRGRALASRGRPARGMSSTRPKKRVRIAPGFVSTVDNIPGPDEGSSEGDDELSRRTSSRRRKQQDISQYLETFEDDGEDDDDDDVESEDDLAKPFRRGVRHQQNYTRSLRKRRKPTGLTDDEQSDEEDDSGDLLQSDLPDHSRRRAKSGGRKPTKSEKIERPSMRYSERATRHVGDMQEIGIDDIFRSGSEDRVPAKPKVTTVREIFKPMLRNSDFRMRHNQFCDTCGQGTNFAPLIGCQGCSLVYHKSCLGHRTNREHLVTKIDDEDFVLQCRRCVAYHRKKDPTAPDLGKCQECHQVGASCRPFRARKTPAQEQKERDDNDGVDPSYDIPAELINNANNVVFRCIGCFRAFHWEHLPSRSDMMSLDLEVDVEQRFREYSREWKCKECIEQPAKVSGLIAWKPVDEDAYDPDLGFDGLEEDEKAYLVRWHGMSYFRARWMPGPWVWGTTTTVMRKAFAKREDAQHPKMRTEDAIPEDYLRTDIVLDIKYTSIVDIHTEEIDKARVREVEKALIKYKGLAYEDAVWEAPPGPDDGERWTDFVTAYNDWVTGRYVRQPKSAPLKARLEKVRKEDFRNLEKKDQPENLVGGKLMEYQIQGLNWLYYKWFSQKNAILADEMGLGKTIQIIGFLATLVQDHNCYPFLVVVPNSTCPNWRREIKRWAPSLRVVASYGSRESRELAYRHELYPDGARDLRCHILVTSYDTAADENCRKFFRGVPWQGLIVDEGQRLKNDKNLLYSALGALKAPFKILLTGTPLQNNARELFNLLHFLDDSHDAVELEKEYEDLTQDKITELHEMIRPFFLRRTKAQVLTFLPPMAQIIVPVSMSIVQKKLYRSILAKNPDLMKAIFSTEAAVKQGERGSLNNILMQLRKCLCHPFVYSKSIEDRNVDLASSHRNLVDASSKLKLLEVLLPKLKERGHRVLIFSQFLEMLDMVEDFMDGMELRYQRLDGSISAMIKQKRIDEYNAPDSPLFAFLLSTRAGGVGINLATADTVIILDPDFNPHQDIQALSRAHRIGQSKKVLCFQLVTRASAEERIMHIGRKKLALDHVLIQEMDADEAEQNDLVSVLRHGANELFEDSGEQDIVYDAMSVERLLDRSHMEDTQAGADKSAETQFSFARVWANDHGALEEAAVPETTESVPDPSVWAHILKERERVAAEEAAAKAEVLGRGRRARANNVDYSDRNGLDGGGGGEDLENSPLKSRKKREGSESDTDFQDDHSDMDDDHDDGENMDMKEITDLNAADAKAPTGKKTNDLPIFRRTVVPRPYSAGIGEIWRVNNFSNGSTPHHSQPEQFPTSINCRACHTLHYVGQCPLKQAGVEHCNLCGIAHFGQGRVCPHIQSETQVRGMLEALKYSNEPEHLVNEARRYLRGVKGSLVQGKRQRDEKSRAAKEAYAAEQLQRSIGAAPYANQPNGFRAVNFTGY